MSVRLEQNKLREYVRQVLITDERTRNDNDRLIIAVYCVLLSERGVCIQNLSFVDVMLKRKAWKLPAFSSITRERQKVQEQDPDLRANDNVQAMRELREEEFKQWAVSQ